MSEVPQRITATRPVHAYTVVVAAIGQDTYYQRIISRAREQVEATCLPATRFLSASAATSYPSSVDQVLILVASQRRAPTRCGTAAPELGRSTSTGWWATTWRQHRR